MSRTVNQVFVVPTGTTATIYESQALVGRRVWQGTIKSDRDVTVTVNRGYVAGEWCDPKAEDFAAGVGDSFSTEVMARQAQMVVSNASGQTANVRVDFADLEVR